jgi:hypothetical protein
MVSPVNMSKQVMGEMVSVFLAARDTRQRLGRLRYGLGSVLREPMPKGVIPYRSIDNTSAAPFIGTSGIVLMPKEHGCDGDGLAETSEALRGGYD